MQERIILAFDGMNKGASLALAEKLSGTPGLWGFKINDLLGECGYPVITELAKYGKVMGDPKWKDIPNTVLNYAQKMTLYGPAFVTVHASGGVEMMREAVKGAGGLYKILGVTVLTSKDEDDCQLDYGCSVKAAVLKFARNALTAKVDHLVCSAKDLQVLKGRPEFKDMVKITPAIRPLWYQRTEKGFDDQKRATTARNAVEMGADLLVIGRPIIRAQDPVEAIRLTMEEIEGN